MQDLQTLQREMETNGSRGSSGAENSDLSIILRISGSLGLFKSGYKTPLNGKISII
jgi:hypothetical protein